MRAPPVVGCLLIAVVPTLMACVTPAQRAPVILSADTCAARPSRADIAAAKGAHAAAKRFFERGDHDGAIRQWTYAYALDCTAHDLLLNIARALEQKGERAASLRQIEAYLKHHRRTPLIEERERRLRVDLAARGQ